MIVFEVKCGHPGVIDDAQEAYRLKLEGLAQDSRVKAIRGRVEVSGVFQHPLLGERPNISAFVIDVDFY